MRSKSVGETTFFLISIFNSLILSTFIIGTILLIAPFEIINILFLFTLFYFLIFKFVRKKIKSISSTISHQSGNLVKSVQESLGSIREILIYKAANFFVPRFKNSNFKLREAEGDTVFVAASPGPLSQSMVIIGAIIFAYYLNSKEVLVDFLPILSAVTFIPLIGSIFILLINDSSDKAINNVKYVAIFTSFANLLLSIFLWLSLFNKFSVKA